MLVLVSALLPALKLAGVLPQEFTWTYLWLTVALGFFFVAGEQLQVVLDAAGRMRLSAAAAAGRQALLVAGLAVIAVAGVGGRRSTVAWLTVARRRAADARAGARRCAGCALWPPRARPRAAAPDLRLLRCR